MEENIKNWQNLWKEEKSTPLDINTLLKNLNKIEKKGKLERIILLITMPITLLILAALLPVFSNNYYLIAIVLISFGMLTLLVVAYKNKYPLINNNTELNNKSYIKNVIDKLKQRMLITSKYMWVYAFFLILGLNIGYINLLQNFELSVIIRIIIHIILTAVLFSFMYYSISKRKKENNNEIIPLIDFLENLK